MRPTSSCRSKRRWLYRSVPRTPSEAFHRGGLFFYRKSPGGLFLFLLSGRGESDPSCMTPSHAYYHYTTARIRPDIIRTKSWFGKGLLDYLLKTDIVSIDWRLP